MRTSRPFEYVLFLIYGNASLFRAAFKKTRNFDAAARRAPCLNLLALVVSGNYLFLYLLKICGVVHFMWYGPMERSVACLQDFLE
jgi:hypothetical protein